MSSDVKKYKIQREKWDAIIRKAAKEAGTNVDAALDRRYTSRETVKDANGKVKTYGWSAYERYLLADGRTLFFSIGTETATVSAKVDKFAQAKVEKRIKRMTRKLEKENAKSTKPVKQVKFNPEVPVLEEAGVSASSKKHNARKARKAVQPVEVTA